MVMEVTTVMVTAITMVVVLNQALTIVKAAKEALIKFNQPMMYMSKVVQEGELKLHLGTAFLFMKIVK